MCYNSSTMRKGIPNWEWPPGGVNMAGKSEYRNSWIAEKLDRINLTVPKGKKDTIKSHAEARGESVNGFINRAIDETMDRDNAGL